MKKMISFLLILVMLCACLSACGNSNAGDSDNVTHADSEVQGSDTAQTTSEKRNYIVQPSNAKQELIPGMLMCYLDYIVDDADYLDYVTVAVTPSIIQTPAQFKEFFTIAEQPDKVAKANALYDEMTATQEGKSIYTDSDFYDSWNLIIISVRESNSQTLHTIDSVAYSNDSCIFFVNGTRTVANGEGEGLVRHFVFRVPKNVYNGVSHSFKKVE